MIRVRTIADNLAGAWQLMLGRPQGLDRIDTSLEGFWESFGAIVVVAPFTLLSLVSLMSLDVASGATVPPLTGGALALNLVALLLDWIAFPLIFAVVARPFGLGARYVPFIVARNWVSVIIGAMVAVVHALHLFGILPSAVMPYLLLAVLVVALRFSYLVARITLAVTFAIALPIVIFDLLISLTIWSVCDRLTAL